MKPEHKFLLSSILLIDFLIVAVTGIMLLFELSSKLHVLIKKIHVVSGVLMIIIIAFHFYTNYNLYKNEGKIFFRNKNKK